MVSLNEPLNVAPIDSTVALYRGLKVAVYEVDKTDLNLTRSDLIELVNVSHFSILYVWIILPTVVDVAIL